MSNRHETVTDSTTFGERFAYALWVAHGETGRAPGFAAIAKTIGRTGPSVGAWLQRVKPPPFHDVRAPLAAYLGVSEAWLFDAVGEPPNPDLWRGWLVKHRHRRASHVVAGKQRKRGA